ncbi:MAG: YhjD/YihY/BrkB family envelope integrity protein [Pseudomonadales bacterium]
MASLITALEEFVWRDSASRSRLHQALLAVLRTGWAVARDMAAGLITLRAMSLVYTTLLSLVPLLAISFSILKGFGVHNQIQPLLENALEPLGERRDEVVERIVDFVDNVQVGVLGTVGFILLFYTTISLMQKIEHAFNDVWQTSGSRSFTERFKDYLTVIVVGPILIFLSVGLSATVMSDPWMQAVANIQSLGWLIDFLGWLVPMAVVVVAFTFIYVFVPHTRVRLLPALTGGLVAGVMWNALGWLFAGFVAQATRYTAIYSGFATPILFMIWLYVAWLILLIGANIAFYRQNPEYLGGRQMVGDLSAAERERLALQALSVIGQCFYRAQQAPDAAHVARRLRVPEQAIAQILAPLELRGLLATTAATPPGYLPACPWEHVSVHEVLETLHAASGSRHPNTSRFGPAGHDPGSPVDALLRKQQHLSQQVLGDVSLQQLVTGTAAEPAQLSQQASARAPS